MSGQVGNLVEAIGMSIVHSLWLGIIWGGVVAFFLLLTRRASPRTRYGIALTGLVGMVVLSLVTFGAIFRPLPSPAITHAAPVATLAASVEATSVPQVMGPVPTYIPRVFIGEASPDAVLPVVTMIPVGFGEYYRALGRQLHFLSPWIAVGWLLGMALLSLRMLGGVWHSRRLRYRGIRPLPSAWQPVLTVLLERAGTTRTVVVLESTLAQVPMVVGWFRPAVLMPVTVLTGMPTAQAELLLAHEIAHLHRLDPVVNLLHNVVETVLFYHPVVWWLSKELRESRELCCDDLAVAWCGHRSDYAKALVHVAEAYPDVIPVAVAATGGSLRQRVERILYGTLPTRPLFAPGLAAIVAIALPGALVSGLVWAEFSRTTEVEQESERVSIEPHVAKVADVPAPVEEVPPATSLPEVPVAPEVLPIPATVLPELTLSSTKTPSPSPEAPEVDNVDVVDVPSETKEPEPLPVAEVLVEEAPIHLARQDEEPQEATLPEPETLAVETPDGLATIPMVDESIVEPRKRPIRATLSSTDQAAQNALKEFLEKQVTVDFENTPFWEAMQFLGSNFDIRIGHARTPEGAQSDGVPTQPTLVPRMMLVEAPLREVIAQVTAAVGMTYWIGPGSLVVGKERDVTAVRTSAGRPWPDIATLEIDDAIISEHLSSILDRWGKTTQIYFHLDPNTVAGAFESDGGFNLIDGMVARKELKGVPLPTALDQLLEPLGLSWWFGRPSEAVADIQPSIWVSTPAALEDIKEGKARQFTFNMAQMTMDRTTKAKIVEAFGTPPAADDSERGDTILIPASILESQKNVWDTLGAQLDFDVYQLPQKHFADIPMTMIPPSEHWWFRSMHQVKALGALREATDASGLQFPIAPPSGGCLHGQKAPNFANWNPFSPSHCGSNTPKVPPSVRLTCEDKLVAGFDVLQKSNVFPAFIMCMQAQYDPPLPTPDLRVAKRAGRRNVALPTQRSAPSAENPLDVTLYHEGTVMGFQAKDRADGAIDVGLMIQYRPEGAGPVPWTGLATNYAIQGDDMMGFFLPGKETDETELLLVRVGRASPQSLVQGL